MSPVADHDVADVKRMLDGVAHRASVWLSTRRNPDGPGFGLSDGAPVATELNATTGGVELWVMLGLPLSMAERDEWIAHLADHQLERTGLVVDPTWRGRQRAEKVAQYTDGDTFFTMTTSAALEALGAQLRHPVRYLADASIPNLEERLDWEWIAHTPHGLGDFAPLVRHNVRLGVVGAPAQWDWINRMLVESQDPTGFWPAGFTDGPLTPHINRAFHVLRSTWNLAGQRIEHADALVDACLAAADDDDFYAWDTGFACNDLDLAHVAYSAAAWTTHRREDLGEWARRALPSILRVEKPGGGFSFHHETAMEEHAGIRMSPGLAEADTWGTLMYLGAIKMMVELGWPGVEVPWSFSRVHAVPTKGLLMTNAYDWWEHARTGPNSIRAGAGTRIAPGARLDGASGPIVLGENCEIHEGALLLPYGGSITLGDNCTVNPYSVIYGHGGVTIGDNVRIATHTVIVPANHVFADPDRPIHEQGVTREGITIEDDVWIGANVTILDGAHIGYGCVVAAGSVVRGRHAPLSIIGGTPARLLKKRGGSAPADQWSERGPTSA